MGAPVSGVVAMARVLPLVGAGVVAAAVTPAQHASTCQARRLWLSTQHADLRQGCGPATTQLACHRPCRHASYQQWFPTLPQSRACRQCLTCTASGAPGSALVSLTPCTATSSMRASCMASKTGGGDSPGRVLQGCVVGVEGREERGRRPEARLRLRHGLLRVVLLGECLGGHVLLGPPVLLRRKPLVVARACRSGRSARYHPTPDLLQCSSLPPAHSNSAVLGASPTAGMAGLGGTSLITAPHISGITRICMPAASRSFWDGSEGAPWGGEPTWTSSIRGTCVLGAMFQHHLCMKGFHTVKYVCPSCRAHRHECCA